MQSQLVDGELAVSFHCALDAMTSITQAHELTVRLEEYLRQFRSVASTSVGSRGGSHQTLDRTQSVP